jgi:hypothetical protein
MKRERNGDQQALRERLEAFRKSKQTRDPFSDPPKVSLKPSSFFPNNNIISKKISVPATTPASKFIDPTSCNVKIKLLQFMSAERSLMQLTKQFQDLASKEIVALRNGEAIDEIEKEKGFLIKKFDDIVGAIMKSIHESTWETESGLFAAVLSALHMTRNGVHIEDSNGVIRDIDETVSLVDGTGRARWECQKETAELEAKINQEWVRLAALKKENECLTSNRRMASMLLTVQNVKTKPSID